MTDIFYEAKKDTNGRIYAEIQKEFTSRYHFHRAFEITYIFEGSEKYLVEDEQFSVDTDQIIFAHRFYRHRSYGDSSSRKYVIAVPANISHDISALLDDSTLPTLMADKEFNRSLRPYFEALIKTDSSTPEIIVKGYVSLIFGLLSEHYKNIVIVPKNRNVSTIIDILNYVDDHFEEPISLTDIAKAFGYNKSYFSRLFNKFVGTSLNDYLNFVRLNRFELLCQSNENENLTDLAFKAGFQSLATFYRAREFRKRNGR